MNDQLEIVPDTEDLHETYAAAFNLLTPVHLVDYMQDPGGARMVCGEELSNRFKVNVRTLNGICPACKAEQERREIEMIKGMASDIKEALPALTEAEALEVAALAVEHW